MMMKTTAGDFAGKYFPKLINDAWDDSKSDEDNLCAVKDVFEFNKKLNERFGHPEAAQVIGAFQDGWLKEAANKTENCSGEQIGKNNKKRSMKKNVKKDRAE